jgi:hypothetical protein
MVEKQPGTNIEDERSICILGISKHGFSEKICTIIDDDNISFNELSEIAKELTNKIVSFIRASNTLPFW